MHLPKFLAAIYWLTTLIIAQFISQSASSDIKQP